MAKRPEGNAGSQLVKVIFIGGQNATLVITYNNNIIIKLYCHIQRALHDELECNLALTHIVPINTIT